MTKENYIKAKEVLSNESKHSFSTNVWANQVVDKWEFANQRVIEELEWITANKDAKEIAYRSLARIKELKQEIWTQI